MNDQHDRNPGTLLRWDSLTSPASLPGYCTSGALPKGPKPTATWWLKPLPSTGLTCGSWATFEADGHHYAWDVRG